MTSRSKFIQQTAFASAALAANPYLWSSPSNVRQDTDLTVAAIGVGGSRGRLFVNRGKLTGKPVEELTASDNKNLDDAVAKLYKDKPITSHMQNFFECVKDRSEPISDVYTYHHTMSSCHMCNIALMVGQDLQWDPEKEVFVDNEMANTLTSRPSRNKFMGIPSANEETVPG